MHNCYDSTTDIDGRHHIIPDIDIIFFYHHGPLIGDTQVSSVIKITAIPQVRMSPTVI